VDHHEAMLLAAVRSGAHIYCEKPLVASPAEADHVLAAADAAGVHIAVAHIGRAFAVLPRLKALIASGKIGRLRRVHGFGKCDAKSSVGSVIIRPRKVPRYPCCLRLEMSSLPATPCGGQRA
jgi:predicted dehydrogenase